MIVGFGKKGEYKARRLISTFSMGRLESAEMGEELRYAFSEKKDQL